MKLNAEQSLPLNASESKCTSCCTGRLETVLLYSKDCSCCVQNGAMMTLPVLYNAAHRDNDVTMLDCELAHMHPHATMQY